ncbi:NYN domain-containing protein [Aestuariirhabdus sp. Z084]|uniref:NYN domain-containing protein n=1 Tax=Aestuariirhabdus haliotis TaxID=2918751 RepID=UPI00201B4106|nr:NYN domain-containing protein [Aestuariirhabdus haliotis]MCL6415517.1 NYN domain-containing protein [Aestuariirhabdus haliotis]MCL6419278.1 NYN domain-containing protein [Aestuariirhabdus haliotis]
MLNKDRIAVFIDADNAPASKMESILSEVAKYGVVSIRRAYGNWKKPALKSWEDILHDYAIQPIQQFDITKGKNAADIALVIDVMDVLYTKQVEVICLVSSDCDYTPLVTRIVSDGKLVIGFGERKAPTPFVNACSKFLYLDDPETINEAVNDTVPIKSDTKLMNLLRQAIEANEDDDGWASLGPVGSHISNQTSFDQRNYGFSKLSDLFRAIDLFELQKIEGNGYKVRDSRKKR